MGTVYNLAVKAAKISPNKGLRPHEAWSIPTHISQPIAVPIRKPTADRRSWTNEHLSSGRLN